jgi:hypothetical protein
MRPTIAGLTCTSRRPVRLGQLHHQTGDRTLKGRERGREEKRKSAAFLTPYFILLISVLHGEESLLIELFCQPHTDEDRSLEVLSLGLS